jgi:hypothetical protein
MYLESPSQNSTPKSSCQPVSTAGQSHPKGGIVILQPITMRIPNSHGVYSPSKLRPPKLISHEEFLSRYANHPKGMRVCFDETLSPATIFERSELITAYGFGLDCWYIIVSHHSIDKAKFQK